MRISPRVHLVTANNPSPMTLDGTNTYLLHEPGAGRVVVVDPGPDLTDHLTAIQTLGSELGAITDILLTHAHDDHTEAVPSLAAATGAIVHEAAGLTDGQVFDIDGLQVEVVATPGHSADSVSLLVTQDRVVLTGDHVLGFGTSVVTHPEGNLADYLASIQRLRDLATEGRIERILPGHGPMVDDVVGWLDYYRDHRMERLDQIRAALAAGATTADEVVAHVYQDTPRELWFAARWSVLAQLE